MRKLIQKLIDSKIGATFFLVMAVIIGLIMLPFKWKKFSAEVAENEEIKAAKIFAKYLELQTENDVCFVRISVSNAYVSLEEGSYFGYISKTHIGKKTKENAIVWAEELIAQKIEEGFIETKDLNKVESTLTKFDDFDYHELPEGLDELQVYIPGGMYLGWLINQNMINNSFFNQAGLDHLLTKIKENEITGVELYELIGGSLNKEMFNIEGNKFSLTNYSKYLKDLKELTFEDIPSIYHIPDDKNYFELISKMLDKRKN